MAGGVFTENDWIEIKLRYLEDLHYLDFYHDRHPQLFNLAQEIVNLTYKPKTATEEQRKHGRVETASRMAKMLRSVREETNGPEQMEDKLQQLKMMLPKVM